MTKIMICLKYFLSLFLLINHVHCEFSDILQLCEDGSCEMSETEFAHLNATKDYAKRMYKLVSAGVPQILWDRVAEVRENSNDLLSEFKVSKKCAGGLIKVSKGLEDMYEWAFRMLDASGKTPSNFFEATMTSLGSYDECLDIARGAFTGQFCMADLFATRVVRPGRPWPGPSRGDRASNGRVNLGDISVFQDFPFMIALCVPSTCSSEELRTVLRDVLEPFLLKPNGFINCDTKDSISFHKRLSSLNIHQMVAISFIGLVVGTVLSGTGIHVLLLFQHYLKTGNWDFSAGRLVSALSILDNSLQLTNASEKTWRIMGFDIFKSNVIFTGVVAHILTCVEIPNSFFVQESHTYVNWVFSSIETQFATMDHGLVIVSFLGGVATYEILVPLARAGKLPYLFAIYDRMFRFLPPIAIMTALEFIWPILWSGPLFTRVADFTVKKCTETWWTNFLFVNNWFSAVDVCAGQSYSLAVDFQLFLMGLIAVFLTVRNARTGLYFSALMIVLGMAKTAYNASVYETTGSMYVPDPIPIKIAEYLTHISMSTSSHAPSYFIGFMVGHLKSTGFRFKYNNQIFWFLISYGLIMSTLVMGIMYKTLQWIPHSMAYIYVNVTRVLQTTGSALYFVHISSLDSYLGVSLDKVTKSSGYKFSFLDTLIRLTFAIYLSHFALIKYEFFTKRSLFETSPYFIFKRIAGTFTFILMFAYVYHVLFLAPFNNLRRIFVDGKKQQVKKTN